AAAIDTIATRRSTTDIHDVDGVVQRATLVRRRRARTDTRDLHGAPTRRLRHRNHRNSHTRRHLARRTLLLPTLRRNTTIRSRRDERRTPSTRQHRERTGARARNDSRRRLRDRSRVTGGDVIPRELRARRLMDDADDTVSLHGGKLPKT